MRKNPAQHSEVVTKLASMVKDKGSNRAVADELGVSQSYLSDLLHGRRTPGPRVLAALGMVKETVYKAVAK